MSDVVRIECNDSIMEVVLNRPKSLNAMNPPLIDGFLQAIDQAKDSKVRAILIRGEGRGFCAGGDIAFFAEHLKAGKGVPREMPERLHEMIEAVHALPKPVIAAVHGPAAGAGMSLVLACDLALASEDAKFNLAYVGIGLSPDGGSTFFLPRHVGLKKAVEIFMMPQGITAADALAMGLINRVLPEAELLTASRALAEQLATGPTAAFAHVKQLVQGSFGNNLHDQLALETELVCASGQTKDFHAGIAAFLEKKKPTFSGQ